MSNDKFQMPSEFQNPNVKEFPLVSHLSFEIWISFEL
jgi:hypothetical protein